MRLVLFAALAAISFDIAAAPGYFRAPAIAGDTLVFTAEGDLWQVGINGGTAQRLTSHPGQETDAAVSPDGKRVAFVGAYEGPAEVYVMPIDGGLPKRLTWLGGGAKVVGWSPDGEVLFTSTQLHPLRDTRLAAVSTSDAKQRPVPLDQASDGAYLDRDTLAFTRYGIGGDNVRGYRGGAKSRYGYVHLRAMGSSDVATFAREFYPVADREGLIIDVRNNSGGNIDSIVIEKLMRRAWAYWQSRDGNRYWNQQDAFRGPIVVLANERTYSDGETFTEGVKRLGLATVVGKRTSGAGVWLSDRNRLADNGIARAAEAGQMGLEGRWLVEGVGVAPDVEVDNPPNATFNGEDAQLDAAIRLLDEKLAAKPMPQPPAVGYPRVQR